MAPDIDPCKTMHSLYINYFIIVYKVNGIILFIPSEYNAWLGALDILFLALLKIVNKRMMAKISNSTLSTKEVVRPAIIPAYIIMHRCIVNLVYLSIY